MNKSVVVSFALGVAVTVLGYQIIFRNKNHSTPPDANPSLAKVCPDPSSVVRSPASVLPPPEFLNDEIFESNRDGEVVVKWKPVKGAKRYRVLVTNSKGEQINSLLSRTNFLYLKDLAVEESKTSAVYYVALQTLNRDDIASSTGDKRKALVKAAATLVAPSIKVIRVED